MTRRLTPDDARLAAEALRADDAIRRLLARVRRRLEARERGVDSRAKPCDNTNMSGLGNILRQKLNAEPSLSKAAAALGLDAARLSRFRRGIQGITLTTAEKLCDYYGIRHVCPRKGRKRRP